MKLLPIFLFCLLFICSCSKAPDCHYTDAYASEANAGCFIANDNKVLFVEGRNGKLSLPGGGLSSGEAPQCTAEREAWEETGIEVVAREKIMTFENGFQLFNCQAIAGQVLNGSKRPRRMEIKAIHWLAADEFQGHQWRFPDQVEWIRGQLNKEPLK